MTVGRGVSGGTQKPDPEIQDVNAQPVRHNIPVERIRCVSTGRVGAVTLAGRVHARAIGS